MITSERFELALEKLKPSDWSRFERLASAFLVVEFPDIRTTATESGDGGRDAEIFSLSQTVFAQYSIKKEWKAKLKDDAIRLREKSTSDIIFLYITNQKIGALADKIRAELFSRGIHIDIRDRSWFVDRVHTFPAREKAAEEIAVAIVDPFLESKGIISRKPTMLSSEESRAALIFIEMQWRDQDRGKGLTKACFEALIKAALRGSDSERRVEAREIYKRVHEMLPKHSVEQLKQHVDGALQRLVKSKAIKVHGNDSYCFSFEFSETLKEDASGIELLRQRYLVEISDSIDRSFSGSLPELKSEIYDFVLSAIEVYLLELGEEFAAAVANNKEIPFHEDLLSSIIINRIPSVLVKLTPRINFFIKEILALPNKAIGDYIKISSDAYTLLAFLAETPDVQAATKKLFGSGEIWLDTTVLLPLFAECVLPANVRYFSELFRRTHEAGIRLYVTLGVLEEIERHFNLCDICDKSENWTGKIPYVYQRYVLSGKPIGGFKSWSEQFFGSVQPEQDIADYLLDEFGINVENIDRYSLRNVRDDVKDCVVNYWMDVHARRRNAPGDEIVAKRLAEHDIESYLYVLDCRAENIGKSMLGFGVWWLTLDVAAPNLADRIRKSCDMTVFSPIISLDFLLRYLLFGPRRENVNLGNTRIFADTLWMFVPQNLKEIAQEIRAHNAELPEKAIQRKIRDALNTQRVDLGPAHENGLEGIENVIRSMF